MEKVKVIDIVGTTVCVSDEAGNKLLSFLEDNILHHRKVLLSFDGVKMLISRFLNVGIGRLYKNIGTNLIEEHLEYIDIDKDDLELLTKKVIPNAKQHFIDEDKSNDIEKEVLGD